MQQGRPAVKSRREDAGRRSTVLFVVGRRVAGARGEGELSLQGRPPVGRASLSGGQWVYEEKTRQTAATFEFTCMATAYELGIPNETSFHRSA